MPSASSTSSTRRRIASGEKPRFSSTNARSRSTWSTTNCASGSWATKPTTSASSRGWCVRVERPNTTTSPPNRPPLECGTSPFAARSSVLLPEPDAPTTSRSSPGSTSRSTSRSAGARRVGIRERHVGDTRSRSCDGRLRGERSAAHGAAPGRAGAASASAGSTCERGPAQRAARTRTRLPSPAIEHDRHRDAAPASVAARDQPVGRASCGAAGSGRAACPTTRGGSPPPSPTAPAEPEHRGDACRRSPTSATNAPPSASSDATPHQPGDPVARAGARRARSRARPSTRRA